MLELPTKEECVGKAKPWLDCRKTWVWWTVVTLVGIAVILVTTLPLLLLLQKSKNEKQQETHPDEAHNCEPCGPTAMCTKMNDTQFRCACKIGYNGISPECTDVDECNSSIPYCHKLANCINTAGSYVCRCKDGFHGDGASDCTDQNECEFDSLHKCHKNAICSNTYGSYRCICQSGYHGDGHACEDVDECAEESHGCADENAHCLNTTGSHISHQCDKNANCTNTVGSYDCACLTGYHGNGFQCKDVDECTEFSECHHKATCKNTVGSFTCSCMKGYHGDGKVCKASTGSRNAGYMITVWIGTLAACVFVFF